MNADCYLVVMVAVADHAMCSLIPLIKEDAWMSQELRSLLLLKRTGIWWSKPDWTAQITCNSSSRRSDALFRPP